jgi:hypothetical protein
LEGIGNVVRQVGGLMKEKVIERLEQLWSEYYNSDRKQIKPPTLDRIVRAILKLEDGLFIETRREVKKVLELMEFIKVREKDNCGISWFCYVHTDSRFKQACLSSKNRVE